MRDTEEYISFEESIFDDWSGSSRLESPMPRGAFFLVAFAAFILIAAFAIRFVFISFVYGSDYAARGVANADKRSTVPAYRGVITDRFGEALVKNVPSFTASLDIAELYRRGRSADSRVALVAKMATILSLPASGIESILEGGEEEGAAHIMVAKDITAEKAIDLRAVGDGALLVEDDYRREYPDPFIFSHILGYTKSVDFKSTIEGKAGLEAQYDEMLRGTDGIKIAYRDAHGTVLAEKKAQESHAGQVLTTTIDAGFQRYFYERFKEGLTSLGKTQGVGIAMNPKTGEILALVSFPSFDNNNPAKYLMTGGNPLFNRAISGVYSPGSTIKPLVSLAALHEKLVTPEFTVYSKGYLELPNPYDPEKPSKFLDWKAQGLVNMYSALARSSNVYFYVVGGGCTAVTCNGVGRSAGLGINRLNKYWKIFGLDKKTGVDMPAEGTGFLPNPTEKEQRTGQPWRIGDTYNVAIGQGDLQVTPIRLLTFFSSLANYGKEIKPHFLLSAGGQEVAHDYSSWTDEITAVRQGVRDVVAKPYGTANALYDLQYKSSGKTGSAQIQNNAKTNAFFMGYGPSDSPELAVLVLVEDAKTGSLNAVPIGHDVMKWYYENRM
ncbi:MAG: hypothetical protein EXS60_01960, partial [Candidatus Pacebacteria bacterium]|nr:hypothetical protein [Candidatus Paceibacterota bacterium]